MLTVKINHILFSLKQTISLAETAVFENFCKVKIVNKIEIRDSFYEKETMTNSNWKKTNFIDRLLFYSWK